MPGNNAPSSSLGDSEEEFKESGDDQHSYNSDDDISFQGESSESEVYKQNERLRDYIWRFLYRPSSSQSLLSSQRITKLAALLNDYPQPQTAAQVLNDLGMPLISKVIEDLSAVARLLYESSDVIWPGILTHQHIKALIKAPLSMSPLTSAVKYSPSIMHFVENLSFFFIYVSNQSISNQSKSVINNIKTLCILSIISEKLFDIPVESPIWQYFIKRVVSTEVSTLNDKTFTRSSIPFFNFVFTHVVSHLHMYNKGIPADILLRWKYEINSWQHFHKLISIVDQFESIKTSKDLEKFMLPLQKSSQKLELIQSMPLGMREKILRIWFQKMNEHKKAHPELAFSPWLLDMSDWLTIASTSTSTWQQAPFPVIFSTIASTNDWANLPKLMTNRGNVICALDIIEVLRTTFIAVGRERFVTSNPSGRDINAFIHYFSSWRQFMGHIHADSIPNMLEFPLVLSFVEDLRMSAYMLSRSELLQRAPFIVLYFYHHLAHDDSRIHSEARQLLENSVVTCPQLLIEALLCGLLPPYLEQLLSERHEENFARALKVFLSWPPTDNRYVSKHIPATYDYFFKNMWLQRIFNLAKENEQLSFATEITHGGILGISATTIGSFLESFIESSPPDTSSQPLMELAWRNIQNITQFYNILSLFPPKYWHLFIGASRTRLSRLLTQASELTNIETSLQARFPHIPPWLFKLLQHELDVISTKVSVTPPKYAKTYAEELKRSYPNLGHMNIGRLHGLYTRILSDLTGGLVSELKQAIYNPSFIDGDVVRVMKNVLAALPANTNAHLIYQFLLFSRLHLIQTYQQEEVDLNDLSSSKLYAYVSYLIESFHNAFDFTVAGQFFTAFANKLVPAEFAIVPMDIQQPLSPLPAANVRADRAASSTDSQCNAEPSHPSRGGMFTSGQGPSTPASASPAANVISDKSADLSTSAQRNTSPPRPPEDRRDTSHLMAERESMDIASEDPETLQSPLLAESPRSH